MGGALAGTGYDRLAHTSMRETDKELVVTVELPGIDPKDVHVECREDVLTIRGESREEEKGQGGEGYSQVQFFRQVQLPPDIDVDRAQASCRNGLVTIRFPKAEQAKNVRRIPISAESGTPGAAGKERAA